VRDKMFFFAAYQRTRSRQETADNVAFVPTAAMLAGDFTAAASPACNAGRQVALAGAVRQQPDRSVALQSRGGEDRHLRLDSLVERSVRRDSLRRAAR
jgi:hypothetical protein